VAAVVVDSDPGWPAEFQAERAVLTRTLREWLVDDVHHIGSTAVPGLPAKPILDMIAGVGRLDDADAAAPALTALGYEHVPHRIDAVLFVKASNGVHTRHLHLVVPGTDLWRERLAFRDALRADPALVQEYRALKEDLLRRSGGAPYAAAAKREFVRRVLEEAGVHLREGRHHLREGRHDSRYVRSEVGREGRQEG
jgi:GrpB-like predicted nucleotidyltransferase (UPF0157 family)